MPSSAASPAASTSGRSTSRRRPASTAIGARARPRRARRPARSGRRRQHVLGDQPARPVVAAVASQAGRRIGRERRQERLAENGWFRKCNHVAVTGRGEARYNEHSPGRSRDGPGMASRLADAAAQISSFMPFCTPGRDPTRSPQPCRFFSPALSSTLIQWAELATAIGALAVLRNHVLQPHQAGVPEQVRADLSLLE